MSSAGSKSPEAAAASNFDELFDNASDAQSPAREEHQEAGEDLEDNDNEVSGLSAMPKIPKRVRATGNAIENATAGDGSDDGQVPEQPGTLDDPENTEQQPAHPKQAEVDAINRNIDAALKSRRGRRRKRTDDDDASIDEMIVELRKRMRDAAYRDIDDNKDRLPAIHKLSMLSDVIEELGKSHLYEAFLDNNIVDSIRLWLEPLDDGSLPSLDIQNAMLDALRNLPIRRDHLRESGIGKIILFMSKCPRISEANRRTCEQFLQQWSRMVLRLSADYRDRNIREAAVNMDERSYTAARPAPSLESRQAPSAISVDTNTGRNGERATARIPQRVTADYTVMPVSSIQAMASPRQSARDAGDKYRRLKQVISKGRRN
ncbi:Transcription factor iws1 [Coemansia sp. RSA 988]|nr:Transcription factor iws1 [Coemansia sp. RSA 988]